MYVENEFHLLFRCEAYAELRTTFISEYHRKQPSLEKLFMLLQTDDVHTINSIIDYISISLN